MSEQSESKYDYLKIGEVHRSQFKGKNGEEKFDIKLQQKCDQHGKPVGESIFPITLANGVQLNEGDYLSMFKKDFSAAVEAGRMTKEEAEDHFRRQDISVKLVKGTKTPPPQKERTQNKRGGSQVDF